MRGHNDRTMKGIVLVQFISLVMESEIRRRVRNSGLFKNMDSEKYSSN